VKKPSILIIFITVLIDLIGFGLILPLIPVYSKNFGASGFVIGAIIASYSLMQFIFAPIWGRVSDRIGRRPVLLGSTFCATLSYVIFAIGSSLSNHSLALWVLLLSRAFAGICGANITVAQAYIADITPPEKRSARMGIIGMAFGLGFILGPLLGGAALNPEGIWGPVVNFLHLPDAIGNTLKHWSDSWMHLVGETAPGWVAAFFCAINFIWAFTRLPESWKPNMEEHVPQRPHLDQWMHTLSTPRLNLLIAIFFLATFCFTCFESTIGLLVMRNFNIDTTTGVGLSRVSWLIAYCGLVGAIVQGGGIGRLVKKMGEPKVIAMSLFVAAIGIGVLPYIEHSWAWLLIALAIFSIGSSLTRPPVFGMISQLTAAHEQGTNIGVAQGVGSLARILGPIFATTLFVNHVAIPYLGCGGLSFVTGLLAAGYLTHIPKPTPPETAPVSS
jgi:DHA1 family tetracycline resistance protein-like MFS transporter